MEIIKPNNVQIKFSDQFLFDTNIWLLLFGTVSNYQKQDQKVYSELFQKIISKQKPIFLTSVILSEFANVLLRIEFKQWKDSQQQITCNYKEDFVGTKEYKDAVSNVKLLINKILKVPEIILVSDSFNAISTDNVYNNFGEVDFNDAYLTALAQKNIYKIVTNDADFKKVKSNISVITNK